MLRHPLLRVFSVSLLALLLSALALLCAMYVWQGTLLGAPQSMHIDEASEFAVGALAGYLRDPALMAVWVGLAGLLLFVWGGVRRVFLRQALIGTLVLPWLLMDILWQFELRAELTSLRQSFEGRSIHERHLGDVDGALYLFTVKAKRLLLDAPEERVLVSYEAVEHAQRGAKVAYHLLPVAAVVAQTSREPDSGSSAPSTSLVTPLRNGDYLFTIGASSLPEIVRSARCGEAHCQAQQLLDPYLIGQDVRGEPLYAQLHQIGAAEKGMSENDSGGSHE